MRSGFFRWLRLGFLLLVTVGFCLLSHPSMAQILTSTSSDAIPATQLQQGRQAYGNGDYHRAVQHWQQAADAYRAAGDDLNQGIALSNLGLAYLQLGQYVEAEGAIATALTTVRALPISTQQQRMLAQGLSAQAQLQSAQGQWAEALVTLDEASDLYRQSDESPGVLRTQLNQAQILRAQGRYRQAMAKLTQVRDQLKTLPDSALKATGLRQLGDTLRLAEDVEQAATVLNTSWEIARNLALPAEESAALVSLGNVAEIDPAYGNAEGYYEEAAAIAPTPLMRLQAQVNLLRLWVAADDRLQAQPLLQAMVTQLPALPVGQSALFVRVNIAHILLNQGQDLMAPEAVANLLAETLQQAQTIQDGRGQSYALGYLGLLYQRNQQLDAAISLSQDAITLSTSLNAPSLTYRWQWQLGQQLVAQGKTTDAIAAYQAAVDTLQSLRSDLVAINPEIRFSFREGVEPIYRELVSLLLQSEDIAATPQTNLTQARDVIESLQVAELVNFFRADCVVTTPVAIEQIDPTAAVIYPIILADRLEVVLSLPGQPLNHIATPVDPTTLNRTLDNLRAAISLPSAANRAQTARTRATVDVVPGSGGGPAVTDYLPLAQQVYDWVIRPLEPQLEAAGTEVLVFVLDGALRNVPMGVLHDGEQFLIEKYALALTPSLQLLESSPLTEQSVQALVAGLSEAREEEEFPPLPFVEQEVNTIQAEAPGEVLFNQTFTTATFKEKLANVPFPIVHLATHGKFSSDPNETFILTWDDRIRASELGTLLQLGEISRGGPVEMLVLSACETATGDTRAALGLAGIAVRSGARSTLATLWQVNDRGTSVLMQRFYQQLANATAPKAEVLRQAQLSLLNSEEYEDPYFWAPFILVGSWL
jgi:CHAT domain-containing protein